MIFSEVWKKKFFSSYDIIKLLITFFLNLFCHIRLNLIIEMIFIFFFYLLFVLFIIKKKSKIKTILNNKILQYLGLISYPLYLLNERIGIVLYFFLDKFNFSYLFSISLVIIVILFISTLVTKFIEVPFLRLKNRFT